MKVEKLMQMGILGDIRQRLGAEDANDTSQDYRIEGKNARTLIGLYAGWQLGDNSWGHDIIDHYEELKQYIDTHA